MSSEDLRQQSADIDDAAVPAVAERATFQTQLDALRVKEKAHTRAGDAIDVENLEDELRNLVEQRVDVHRAREPLRHLEQERELLLGARRAIESGSIVLRFGEIRRAVAGDPEIRVAGDAHLFTANEVRGG